MTPVVMLAPYFPPSTYVVGRRPTRFASYLRQSGWEPLVLTLPEGGGRGRDELLAAEVAQRATITEGYASGLLGRAWWRWDRFKTRQRAAKSQAAPTQAVKAKRRAYALYELLIANPTTYLAVVDHLLPYVLGAARQAARLARERAAPVIYATGCPYSALLAGALAGRLARRPVVLDFQDPWTLDPLYFPQKPRPVKAIEAYLERLCFSLATTVILNTERCRDAYQALYPEFAGKMVALHNGYDRAAMQPGAPFAYEGFSLVHFGNFYATRSLAPILRAIASAGPSANARVICYGQVPAHDREEAARLGIPERLEVRAPIPYADSLRALEGASALLLLQPPEIELQVPSKLFDYLATTRPVLSLSANPEIGALLQRTGRGLNVDIRDDRAIEETLGKLLRGEVPWNPGASSSAEHFDAPAQTRALAALLEDAARRPAP